MIKLHYCEPLDEEIESSHYGTAIGTCAEDEYGKLWVDNEEYGNSVNYCPFCGFKANVSMNPKKYSDLRDKLKDDYEKTELNKKKWPIINEIRKYPPALYDVEKKWSCVDSVGKINWHIKKMSYQPEKELQNFLDFLILKSSKNKRLEKNI